MKDKIRLTSMGLAFALAAVFSSTLGHSQEGPSLKAPATIQECEQKSGSYICLNWKWNGSAYEVAGPDGNVEKIAATFTPSKDNKEAVKATFVRDVNAGSADGLRVVYTAELRNGKIENGVATWSYKNIEKSGAWNGSYSYNAQQN